MRPIAGWRHLMASNVLVATPTGIDDYGKPTFGTPVTYRAHLSRQRRMVRNVSGQEVVSEQTLYLATTVNIDFNAQLTLSSGDVGSTESWALHPNIVAIERRFDQRGPHHVVLYL
jgi:hypothetical protein